VAAALVEKIWGDSYHNQLTGLIVLSWVGGLTSTGHCGERLEAAKHMLASPLKAAFGPKLDMTARATDVRFWVEQTQERARPDVRF